MLIKHRDTAAHIDHKRAASAGTNRTYIKQADQIVEAGRDDLISAIEKGQMTISQAKVVGGGVNTAGSLLEGRGEAANGLRCFMFPPPLEEGNYLLPL